jgi:hypothetical protein
MKTKLKLSVIGKALFLALPAAVMAPHDASACPSVNLPVATAANSAQFGDAISYGLPAVGLDVPSTPGQISDCIVVATGSSGNPVNQNAAGMDDAYPTPSGTGGSTFFRTGDAVSSPDPGSSFGAFTGQTATTWDIRLTALDSFLAGADPIIMFNHNQTNSGATIDQNLVFWAQLALVDDAGVLPTKYFYFTSVPNTTGIPNFGDPGGDPFAYTGPQTAATNTYPSGSDAAGFPVGGVGTGTGSGDASFMVLAPGQVCLDGPVGVGLPQPCDGTEVATVNLNLGADHAAEAIIFPEINAILDTAGFGGYDVVQADLRFGCNALTITGGQCPAGFVLNNGFEQIFIVAGTITQVPEPATLALLGLALAALGWSRIRTRKR